MNRGLSLYLDLIRFSAAMGVLLGHSRALMAPVIPKILAVHASECVIVFFLLSGFVIRYVSRSREQDWKSYASARATRLYSVAIPAIVVTLVLDRIGLAIAPEHYASLQFFDGPGRWTEILASLAFLNEVWRAHVVVGSNEAYWSLGFEAAYYVAFCAVFLRSLAGRIAFLVLWLAVFGPLVAAYGLLWLMGVWLYDVVSDPAKLGQIPKPFAWIFIASPLVYPVLKYVVFPPVGSAFHAYDVRLTIIAWCYAALLATAFALHIAGVATVLGRCDWIGPRSERAVRWLAGATFTVYLMHQPLIIFLSAVLRTEQSGAIVQVGAEILAFCILLALAEIGERRKSQIKAFMHSIPRRKLHTE